MKIKLAILLGGFLVLFLGIQVLAGAPESQNLNFQTISPPDAKAFLESGARYVLLDVRNYEEYQIKHIPHSILVPLDKLEQEAATRLLDKTIPIIVYCQVGKRSLTAAQLLVKLGYQHIYYLGGINDWPYETISGEMERPL